MPEQRHQADLSLNGKVLFEQFIVDYSLTDAS
jgi:hypothetical protein